MITTTANQMLKQLTFILKSASRENLSEKLFLRV